MKQLLWATAIDAIYAYIDVIDYLRYCELLVDFTIAGFWVVKNTEETLPKFLYG